MRKVAPVIAFALVGGAAHAGPTARFGLTGAIEDQGAPGKYELGPLVAIGERSGPFVGEVEWAYLSFFDPDTTGSMGVQRVGVSLRADVFREYAHGCQFRYGCTQARSIWAEVGAAERFGQWQLDATHVAPSSSHLPEAHVAIGFEIDNQISPMRNGWQLGLRFAFAPHGSDPQAVCRGDCPMTTTAATTSSSSSGGYDGSVLLEWMFLFGY